MENVHVAVLLLAGGRNSRMGGRKKADLLYQGETFCEHIAGSFREAGLSRIYLSVAGRATGPPGMIMMSSPETNLSGADLVDPTGKAAVELSPLGSTREGPKEPSLMVPMVEDEIPGQGPLGGIVSGFHAIGCDALFVSATDTPRVDAELIRTFYAMWQATNRKRLCVAETKHHIHPLFGIYPREVLPVAEKMLAEGDRRMMHLLKETGAGKLYFENEALFENVNTPQSYEHLVEGSRREKASASGLPGCPLDDLPETESASCGGPSANGRDPRVICVAGAMGSGKTTLIEKLLPEMTSRGYHVAVIKHDGHDFTCDREGTDSDRFMRAGAYGTAVFSRRRIFIHKEEEQSRVDELIGHFPEADLIMIEGLKEYPFPKIETVREGECPISNPEGRFLLVTEEPEKFEEDGLGFEDIQEIADRIETRLGTKSPD